MEPKVAIGIVERLHIHEVHNTIEWDMVLGLLVEVLPVGGILG